MPARLRDIIRAAEQRGVLVEKPGTGSHWKLKGDGARTFPIAAHNGPKTEIDDKYIRGLCRNFGWDYAAFKAEL